MGIEIGDGQPVIDMELSFLTINTRTIIVVESECDVTRLLYLVDQNASTQSVNGSRRQIDHVACGDRLKTNNSLGFAVPDGLSQYRFIDTGLQAEGNASIL